MVEEWIDEATSRRVAEMVARRVGPLIQVFRPTPLTGALQVASIDALSLCSQSSLDEEELTYTLLGTLKSSISSFSLEFPGAFCPQFYWQRYSKGGRSLGGEAASGADFAFIIRLTDEHARVAIFQAKKVKDTKSLDVSFISPFRTLKGRGDLFPEPQILRLVSNAQHISGDPDLKNLNWVHYAGYEDDGCFCTPISDHIPFIEAQQRFNEAKIAELKIFKNSLEEVQQVSEHQEEIKPSSKNGGASLAPTKTEVRESRDVAKRKDKSTKLKPHEIAATLKQKAIKLWNPYLGRFIQRSPNSVELTHLLSAGASEVPGKPVPGWLTLSGKDDIADFIKNAKGSIQLVQANVRTSYDLENNPGAGQSTPTAGYQAALVRFNASSKAFIQAGAAAARKLQTEPPPQDNIDLAGESSGIKNSGSKVGVKKMG